MNKAFSRKHFIVSSTIKCHQICIMQSCVVSQFCFVRHGLCAVRLVYIWDHAHPFCVTDQKYQLLTTPIFPQNSDKTWEWTRFWSLKPLSLLFYYYSPQHPQLGPAISLKPVRVSASRMDRLMGGRRLVCVCVCVCDDIWQSTNQRLCLCCMSLNLCCIL